MSQNSFKSFMVAVTLVVAAFMAFPPTALAESFWHDEMSREDWGTVKEREPWLREQAAACIRERLRVSDAHGQAAAYLDRRDRTLSGGYVGSGIIIREERRIQRIAYRGFDAINAISYSLAERIDPASECKGVADAAIAEIKAIIERYP